MNERLKELADQCWYDDPVDCDYDHLSRIYRRFSQVKFAELIVRECADIAYKTSWDDLVYGYGLSVIPIHLYDTIKEHFGVEE